ncbi:MAG: hypothetical protein HY723_06715 [Chloroflexi bacterium]|nr:hypothetical protein [Chloroflexota bacterium]
MVGRGSRIDRGRLTVLPGGIEALRQAFNRDAGHVRVLMLTSPTCDMCRQGASVMQTAVLDTISDPSLRAYVAWVPILPDDKEPAAVASRALVPNTRAAHFWDAGRALPPLFAAVLGLPEGWPAWDVYLLYDRGATWEQEPPAPVYWEHQLGDQLPTPRLDGARFAARVRAKLESA